MKLPLGTYQGSHTLVSIATNAVKVVADNSTITPTGADYDSSTGKITFTSNGHSLAVGTNKIRILKGSLTYTCSLDNNATEHSYPRVTDPIFDNIIDSDQSNAGFGGSLDGNYSLQIDILAVTTNTFTVRITKNGSSGTVPSAAEYIRDIGTCLLYTSPSPRDS